MIFITDDGECLDQKTLDMMNSKKITSIKNLHFGLQNIKLRLNEIGGSIKYFFETGEGTEVKICIGKQRGLYLFITFYNDFLYFLNFFKRKICTLRNLLGCKHIHPNKIFSSFQSFFRTTFLHSCNFFSFHNSLLSFSYLAYIVHLFFVISIRKKQALFLHRCQL